MNAIEIQNLDFSYRNKEPLLQDIHMHIPEGSIYGFLGPNGAGKTTTLKLILNLLKHTSKGSIEVLGKDVKTGYPSYLKHIGSLIEDASVYEHLSASKNLRIWKHYYKLPDLRIDEVLETVGLRDAGNKKVQDFSTGMKQRLGLGIAIMHDPKILILDEPTNGLDPMGIRELRALLKRLRDQGKTILLSSHILSEVEKLVDYIGVINSGRIVFEGSLEQLNTVAKQEYFITIQVDDLNKAQQVLSEHFPTEILINELSVAIPSKTEINTVARILLDNDVELHALNQVKMNLETLFMSLAK